MGWTAFLQQGVHARCPHAHVVRCPRHCLPQATSLQWWAGAGTILLGSWLINRSQKPQPAAAAAQQHAGGKAALEARAGEEEEEEQEAAAGRRAAARRRTRRD